MRKIITCWMCVGVAVMMVGCISTPERRIAKHPELFGTFPPEIQESIRNGKVAIGFTPDMVRMALGVPDRIHALTTAAGEMEVWMYMGIAYDSSLEPIGGSYVYRDRYGRYRRAPDTRWVSVERAREYPVLRLEFEAGRVKAIERMK